MVLKTHLPECFNSPISSPKQFHGPSLTIYLLARGLAVASIARDDPSPLTGMHRDNNAPACTASAGARGKFGSEFET